MALISRQKTWIDNEVLLYTDLNNEFNEVFDEFNGNVDNANIKTAAGIVYSKLSLTNSILNADINSSAAIAYSKLALTGSIVNADIGASAAIAYSKLALTGAVLNADLAGSIAASKISNTAATLSDTQTLTNKTLTSPKIGTAILDTNGNELVNLTATASAVNEITYANAATGNAPSITATGGDTNIHIAVNPKGDAFTKFGGLRNDNGSATYKANTVIVYGWGFIATNTGVQGVNETASFGVTFTAAPVVLVSLLGYVGSTPTDIGDFTNNAGSEAVNADTITTTGFRASIFDTSGSNFVSAANFGYSWMAIGVI